MSDRLWEYKPEHVEPIAPEDLPDPSVDAKYFSVRFREHYTGKCYVTGTESMKAWFSDDAWKEFIAKGLNDRARLSGDRGVFAELLQPDGLKLNVD